MSGESNYQKVLRSLNDDAQLAQDQAATIEQQRSMIEKLEEIERVQAGTITALEKIVASNRDVESAKDGTNEALRHQALLFEELVKLKDSIIESQADTLEKYRWLDAYLDLVTKPSEQVEGGVHVV